MQFCLEQPPASLPTPHPPSRLPYYFFSDPYCVINIQISLSFHAWKFASELNLELFQVYD